MILGLAACGGWHVLEGSGDPAGCDESFEDHTLVGPASMEELRALSADDGEAFAAEMIIASLPDPSIRKVRWVDRSFYRFHDEWYWFRLLNGELACGASTDPIGGLRFSTVPEVYAWARDEDVLPLDLEWVEYEGRDRLYSESFYALAFTVEPRSYGTGAVRWRPEEGVFALELWRFDTPTDTELALFREALEPVLPAPLVIDP
ncbi:MAG: hypothetical protein KC656_11515 [Myxococcales bacterium]|nr:hypothetical protein [Myxococcales bacterium]MCB9668127.1 hypothetical protein [Alphaproteobacteria bacterium]MCB9694408.1 hypothetical protein [Alphaproteobacteria bacterium]